MTGTQKILAAALAACSGITAVARLPAQTIGGRARAGTDPSLTLVLPDYTKLRADQMEDETSRVLERWRDMSSKMILQIENPATSPLVKAESMYLLGALRMDDAVPILVEHINFIDTREILLTHISDRGGYIARRSLIQIGEPSAEWIRRVIADDLQPYVARFDASEADGFAKVLAGIETPQIAFIKLRQGLARAKSAKVRAQYTMVIRALQKPAPRVAGKHAIAD